MIYMLMTILDVEVGAENIHMAKSSSPQPINPKNYRVSPKKVPNKIDYRYTVSHNPFTEYLSLYRRGKTC